MKLKEFENYLLERSQPATAKAYAKDIESFILTVDSVESATNVDIENWLRQFNTASTKARKLASVRKYYKFLEAFYGVNNPSKQVDNYKIKKKVKAVPSEAEIALFMDCIDSKMYKALFYIYISTGVRRTGVLQCTLEDYNRENGEIQVVNKGGDMMVKVLTKKGMELMEEYLNTRTDSNPYLFIGQGNKGIDPSCVHRYFKKTLEKAGLNEEYTIHSLRHAFCHKLLDNGIGIEIAQQLLGHKNIATTVHYVQDFKKQAELTQQLFE